MIMDFKRSFLGAPKKGKKRPQSKVFPLPLSKFLLPKNWAFTSKLLLITPFEITKITYNKGCNFQNVKINVFS
jgi:hypothetical protein